MKTKKRLLRGFTLIEMIIVLAIIAIIVGVFLPAINRYITRSRLNASNADARVIFNSLQTICQEIEFSDRVKDTSELYNDKYYRADDTFPMDKTKPLILDKTQIAICAEEGRITKAYTYLSYKDAAPGGGDLVGILHNSTPTGGDAGMVGRLDDGSGPTGTITDNTKLMQRMYRLYDNNGSTYWCALIQGYLVKGVICANDADNEYLGGYPLKSTERGGFNSRSGGVADCPFIDGGGSFNMEDVMRGTGLTFGDSDFGFYYAMDNYVDHLTS